MKKILMITPHLSTGGLPQFLLDKIEILLDNSKISSCLSSLTNCSREYKTNTKKIALFTVNMEQIVNISSTHPNFSEIKIIFDN